MREFEEKYWKEGTYFIAGIDEAGRGPLAGPVVAASVVFPDDIEIDGIDDSKKLTPEQREELYCEILDKALSVAVGAVDNTLIDRINILQASYTAMMRSLRKLSVMPEVILIDGSSVIPGIPIKQEAIIKGDGRSVSIAAASIIAKVYRDRIMEFYGMEYPEYDFSHNKGYATREHVNTVIKVGTCEIHRKSFSPIRELLSNFIKR
ncbi:MAG: ribonuclease HII [candidate division WOR-3 bacterium]|nr:ribonuclease HII [candidate division WOR-3 bacterium]